MSILDLDNYTDAVKDVVNGIADSTDVIGAVLKSVAPVLAAIPGLGTGFAVAVYAAGALSAGDTITDATIGTVGAAMPPGIPQIAYHGATNITRDIVNGDNAFSSIVNTCRETAAKAGGPQAVAAFDSGLSVARGGAVDPRAIAAGREYALTGGGQAAAASYDAGIALAKGGGVTDVSLAVTRGYVRDMGGPLASAAFDTSIALAYGKTLQEAGYEGLHTFVRGNDAQEKVLNFIEQIARGKKLGIAIPELVRSDLVQAFLPAITAGGVKAYNATGINETLKPYIDALNKNPGLIELPSGQWASEWHVDEIFARTAQAVMRDGHIDTDLMQRLYNGDIRGAVASIGRVSITEEDRAEEDARWKSIVSANPDTPLMWLRAVDAIARKSSAAPYLITQGLRAWQEKGAGIVASNPEIGKIRSVPEYPPQLKTNTEWRQGFDIGTAVSVGKSTSGPGQDAVRSALPTISMYNGFNAARAQQYMLTKLRQNLTPQRTISTEPIRSITQMSNVVSGIGRISTDPEIKAFATQGAAIAAADPLVGRARTAKNEVLYQYGFDVGTAVAQGKSATGPGQTAIRNRLNGGPSAATGFDVAQALQHGLTLARAAGTAVSSNAGVAIGELVSSGLAGNDQSVDQKTNTLATIATDPAAKQGIANTVEAKGKSLWTKFLEFFGLA